MPEFAKSADGTVIAFDCVGYGPAFVVCGLSILMRPSREADINWSLKIRIPVREIRLIHVRPCRSRGYSEWCDPWPRSPTFDGREQSIGQPRLDTAKIEGHKYPYENGGQCLAGARLSAWLVCGLLRGFERK